MLTEQNIIVVSPHKVYGPQNNDLVLQLRKHGISNDEPQSPTGSVAIHRFTFSPQKTLNPNHFYDQRGSALFEQITRLPEYYPTRTEVGILQRQALRTPTSTSLKTLLTWRSKRA